MSASQRLSAIVGLTAALVSAGCSKPPPEPDERDRQRPPAATSEPLSWQVPPAWTLEQSAASGELRARYQIPAQGDAKHPAELVVSCLGKGSRADIGARLAEAEGDFEAATPRREQLTAGAIRIELLDVAGTYKYPMGPPVGPKKRPPAQVLKENWRALVAGVSTADRGAWLFRMVGPHDTVASARSAFVNLLRGLR
jgi:hypothetical protein